MDNPYAAPNAHIEDKSSQDGTPIKKVKSPKVIGIILLIMTPIGMLTMLGTLYMAMQGIAGVRAAWEASGMSMPYIYVTYSVGILMSFWVLFIAIQLIKYKHKGREHYNYYFITSIIFSVISAAYQAISIPETASWGQIMSQTAMGSLLTIGLLLLGWYFLNKEKTKACLT